MTGYELFMQEANNCGLDSKIANDLYNMLYDALSSSYKPRIELEPEEAILANFLLAKFGARLHFSTHTRDMFFHHYYYVLKLL